jgi:heterodisulfide reductase subunit C
MKKLKEIKLSRIQLDVLLNRQEKDDFGYLLKHGVYCTRCNEICTNGVLNYTVWLNWLNDIVLEGECAVCGQKVTRVIEFGENKSFFDKAMDYRESLQN